MTWNTSQGKRVLGPVEGRLFADCLGTMMDMAEDGIDAGSRKLNFGLPLVVGPFQRLTEPQKYAVLEDVTTALLTPTPSVPRLSAVNESAIYYVFRWLYQQFDDLEAGEEIWGEQILAALTEIGALPEDEVDPDEPEYLPRIGCMDQSKWENGIETLADNILWDRDFEMESNFPPGAASRALMQVMSIDFDYFNATVQARRGAKGRLHSFISAHASA